MPLNTQIIRDGEPVKVRWSGFHVAAMVVASTVDSCKGPFQDVDGLIDELNEIWAKGDPVALSPKNAFDLADYGALSMSVLNEGEYTIQNIAEMSFVDITDGEVFTFRKGDVLRAYRN